MCFEEENVCIAFNAVASDQLLCICGRAEEGRVKKKKKGLVV